MLVAWSWLQAHIAQVEASRPAQQCRCPRAGAAPRRLKAPLRVSCRERHSHGLLSWLRCGPCMAAYEPARLAKQKRGRVRGSAGLMIRAI
jgi:hypothetical protein